jgi:hemerythrin superfamily protein
MVHECSHAMRPTTATTKSSLAEQLLSDHRELDTLFDALLLDIQGGDPPRCQATWARFELALLNHIDAEEIYLLPSFDRVDPLEAAGIRQEHATLRRLLAEMGVRLELHAVKEENVRRLIDTLRKHARREEVVLYRWADQLAPELTSSLAARLARDS